MTQQPSQRKLNTKKPDRRRVSQYFGLSFTQASLDFVDVSIRDDLQVYIDPNALRVSSDQWAHECTSLIQNFFQRLMLLIRNGRIQKAKALMSPLTEPNEIHFGVSRGRSRGHGLGPDRSAQIIRALTASEAVRTGIVDDLEETVLLIDGIGPDLISDVIANVIRGALISYTQRICKHYRIPLEVNVASGPIWDPSTNSWVTRYTELPVAKGKRLILVPKFVVRKKLDFDAGTYYNHYILTYLKDQELRQNTDLVHLIKDRKRSTRRKTTYKKVVYKKDVAKKHGTGKQTSSRVTVQQPDILRRYSSDRRQSPTGPMSSEDLDDAPEYCNLLRDLTTITPGSNATQYENAIEALLSALFEGQLSFPEREAKIHGGRKRIDVVYSNTALFGFFKWLGDHYPAAYIVVEGKNYAGDPANPELDQITGRFSPTRGKVGLLVCRSFTNKHLFIERCRDTVHDDRGFVVALDDGDLEQLVAFRQANDKSSLEQFLRERFAELVR